MIEKRPTSSRLSSTTVIPLRMIEDAFEIPYIALTIAHLTGVSSTFEKFSGAMNVARQRLEKHAKARILRFWLYSSLKGGQLQLATAPQP